MTGVGSVLAVVSCAVGIGCASRPPTPQGGQALESWLGAVVERAESAREAGDLGPAVKAYREAVGRQPWNDRLRRSLAAVLAQRAKSSRAAGSWADVASAETDLREALELAPDDPLLRRDLAVVLVDLATRSMDPQRAQTLRREAARLAPDVAAEAPRVDPLRDRQMDMALELVKRGQLEAGIQRLATLHRERPDDVEIAVLLAQATARRGRRLADHGQWSAAEAELETAVAILEAFDVQELPAGGPEVLERIRHNLDTARRNAH